MKKLIIVLLAVSMFSSCASKIVETGKASFYADRFVGRPTASGETFRQTKRTAAHRTLPFGTRVTVVNTTNGRKVIVRINDRGPFVSGRIIDLSKKAARKIDMVQQGVATVQLKYKKSRSR